MQWTPCPMVGSLKLERAVKLKAVVSGLPTRDAACHLKLQLEFSNHSLQPKAPKERALVCRPHTASSHGIRVRSSRSVNQAKARGSKCVSQFPKPYHEWCKRKTKSL